jgi:penicillin-binding protein 1A
MLRLLGWLFGFGVFCLLGAGAVAAVYLNQVMSTLPDYTVLKDYQPPVTTRVHAADGTLLAEYARERRLFQPIETITPLVINAFISAEDKSFWEHEGIDYVGLARATLVNIGTIFTGDGRIQGASTITQQVAKNMLLTSDRTIMRKLKEAFLARRIERAGQGGQPSPDRRRGLIADHLAADGPQHAGEARVAPPPGKRAGAVLDAGEIDVPPPK